MTLTLYTAPMSTATITEAVLAELGLEHKRVVLDIQREETRSPDFRKLNPNGRVPTIVDDGTPIWESAAITLYLGEQHGVAAGLYPPPGPSRGEAMKWIIWSNTMLAAAAGRLAVAMPPEHGGVERGSQDFGRFPDQPRDAEAARQEIADLLTIIDEGLEGRDYLLGTYSLADTHMGVLMMWLTFMGFNFSEWRNLAAWHRRLIARPMPSKLSGE